MIVARDDRVTPRLDSDERVRGIPGAQDVVLDGGGHFTPQIEPGEDPCAVGAFRRAQPAPRVSRGE